MTDRIMLYVTKIYNNRPFPSSLGPLFENEGRCLAFDMLIIFHSHANKTHYVSFIFGKLLRVTQSKEKTGFRERYGSVSFARPPPPYFLRVYYFQAPLT